MKTKPLTQVCNITTGKLNANAEIPNGKYPFFTCAPNPLRIDTFAFDDDVILLAGNNAQGNFHIQRFKGKFNAYQRTYVITAKDGYDIDYIKYSLELSLQHLKRLAQGSQTKFLTMQILDSFQVINIPQVDQRNLVGSICEVDRNISLNTHICSELEAMAKTLYDYWFVQFDFPDENGKPYRTSGGEMVWNEQLKRKIPKGWACSPISSICDIISGYPFQSSSYSESGKYRLITIKNVQDDGINLNIDSFINDLPDNLPDYCILSPGDILMSLTGNVGRVGLMYANDCLLNQRVALLRPTESTLKGFLYMLFKSKLMRIIMENLATGTSQKNLSPVDTGKVLITYNAYTVKKFCHKVNPIIDKITMLERENDELIKLRDWLLPMLMNRQARVE